MGVNTIFVSSRMKIRPRTVSVFSSATVGGIQHEKQGLIRENRSTILELIGDNPHRLLVAQFGHDRVVVDSVSLSFFDTKCHTQGGAFP